MWTVYNEFGEVVCTATSEQRAADLAEVYNGTYAFVGNPWGHGFECDEGF